MNTENEFAKSSRHEVLTGEKTHATKQTDGRTHIVNHFLL